jgi:hypothetical protein
MRAGYIRLRRSPDKGKLAMQGRTMQDLVAELSTEWVADESSQ